MVPHLGIHRAAREEYLLGGLLPWARNKDPLPADLENEIAAHPNLVCYDWEYSPERLRQWYGMFQLGEIMFDLALSDTRTPGHKWLEAMSPKLGNAGTEISLTAPNEITVLRNSTTGLTAFELSALAYWLDAPKFPFGTYDAADRHGLAPLAPPHRP